MIKRVAFINTWGNGSTGQIVKQLQKECSKHNIETISIYGRFKTSSMENAFYINNKINLYIDAGLSRIFDNQGRNSYFNTLKIIKLLDSFQPDIIHIHNLHGYWINYEILFKYIKDNDIGVVWTLHDSWPFTGHCACWQYIGCKKFKTGCGYCPGQKLYPKALIDRSHINYLKKKNSFTKVNNLFLVTPSDWLNKTVQSTFLNCYPIATIHNGINRNIFSPVEYKFLFEKYPIKRNKKIILYVAMNTNDPWKGLDILLETMKHLNNKYQLVIVGESKDICKENIISIGRTENQNELAAFYSMADVLANPSLDDNYPTINLEALACGLPVATFHTGGISEQIDNNVGRITYEKTPQALKSSIEEICNIGKTKFSDSCFRKVEDLEGELFLTRYLDLYQNVGEKIYSKVN